MRAYLHYHRGRACIVFTDSQGEALPALDTRRAWRSVVYRPPVSPCGVCGRAHQRLPGGAA